jgi:pimeloyl-ACP methyl ester carboxylesterase
VRLDTSDGASIVVHELAGHEPLPPLLISHATGFHAHCYVPIGRALGDRFHVWGLDHRGHGDSAVAAEWEVDWHRFGDDTLAVAGRIAPHGGLVGVGHSMGGASLLMAAHADPSRFAHLVLFEPIAGPRRTGHLADVDMRSLPIVQGAFRRRRRFPSRAEARQNYAAKPPLSLMTDEVLDNYVEHGFRDVIDEHGSPAVELCCPPELEAAIFMGGRDNGVWELLADIEVPCTIVSGMVLEMQPSASTALVADELPNATFVLESDQTHFGPFSHPDALAALTRSVVV